MMHFRDQIRSSRPDRVMIARPMTTKNNWNLVLFVPVWLATWMAFLNISMVICYVEDVEIFSKFVYIFVWHSWKKRQ